jgi:hypothetical protein
MDTSSFDPTMAVVFDLAQGQVNLADGGAMLMVPADALAQVCGSLEAGAVRRFGEVMGKQAGERVSTRLGVGAIPTLEVMVNQLGGELSLAGLGALSIERWGDALVVQIEGCPLGSAAHSLMSAYVEGAVLGATGRAARAVPLERSSSSFRLLLCGDEAASRVQGWLAAGRTWGDALAALHRDPSSDAEAGKY